MLFTASDGSVVEERRYEPFGEPIDAYRESAGAGQPGTVGAVDFRKEPVNGLNKETDFNTGYSHHGARWMAPRLGRWLTPDPPTKAPDPRFLAAPWDLNPYAYVRGNPLVFWDPDGQDWKSFGMGLAQGAAKAFVGSVVVTATVTAVVAAAPAAAATVAAVSSVAAGVALGQAAYGAYQNRHELVGMAHRYWSGTNTDNDDHAVGEFAGGVAGSAVGGAVGARLGGAAGAAVRAKLGPSPAPSAPAVPGPSCSGALCTSGNCFVAGTLVATATGLEAIETVKVGDLVLARDGETGESGYRPVEEIFVRRAGAVEDVTYAMADGHEAAVTTTLEHPFWVEGRGWTKAGDLEVGEGFVTADGRGARVVALRARGRETEVFNFRVEGMHSYFVGEELVWVHNPNCGGTASASPRHSGPTKDPNTGREVGRFIADSKGNAMIEPKGGTTVGNSQGTFAETLYPNGSPYQQLHDPHRNVPNAHGHGFEEGPGLNGRGASIDPNGNNVATESPDAHWPVNP